MKTLGFGTPKAIAAAVGGVAIVTGAVWGVARWPAVNHQPDPTIVPKELSAEALTEQAKTDPAKLGETMRETFRRDDLSDEQRDQIRSNMRQAWTGMIDDRVDQYFATAPEDRDAFLDKQIDEWQSRMKEWEERRRQRERERQAGDQQNGGGDEQAQAERNRRGWRGPQTREQRKVRSESRDPDESARRAAYFSAIRKRAQVRGIEMPGPPDPGQGGPRGPGSGRRPG